MTWRRALACLLVAAIVAVFAEGARLRRVLAPNGPKGRWAS